MIESTGHSDLLAIKAIRLAPRSDLQRELKAYAVSESIKAGVVMAAVGSLSEVCLRYADQKTPSLVIGCHEVLTLSGTFGGSGIHLHMMVANGEGHCRGGHVVEGCLVYTTLELVLGVLPDLKFDRVHDAETGYRELKIRRGGE